MFLAASSDAGAHRRNLARLSLLRGVLVAALVGAAAFVEGRQGLPLHRDGGLLLALLLFAGCNAWTLWRLRRGGAVGEAELFLQLVADVLLMTLVLYRTGGATNPFISYFLVPLTIAAATLRPGFTVSLALLTLSAYTLLLRHYIPFGPFGGQGTAVLAAVGAHAHHAMGAPGNPGASGFNLHVFGMWLNFLLSAGLITVFVSRMSRALREQDRQLAEQHEHLLQREQVVALGALAAGAAHELGTPLATMSVIARELEAGLPQGSSLHEDAVLLRRQLGHCRGILHGLRAQATGEATLLPLTALLRGVVARLEVLHPQRRFQLEMALPDRVVQAPSMLPQVLTNLLDNAAQAARTEVRIQLRDEADCCVVDIHDDGRGIAPDVAARLGQPFVSGRAEGLGIGYFLSHATVNQWGGSIHLQAAEVGTLTRLRLPWSLLQPVPTPGESA